MVADKLPELIKTQVEAVKGIKIDKVTVWDSMGNGKALLQQLIFFLVC